MLEIVLKTKRLILRKPKPSDWEDIIEGAGEYDVAKMTENIPHPYTKKDAARFIRKMIAKWKEKEKKDLVFFLELKKEHKVIGAMGLHKISAFRGIAETGSWINKKYWRQGYITEAKIAVNDFAFNKLKLMRLNSPIYKDNKASNATQIKMGYKLEGVQRKGTRNRFTGKATDLNLYGLLKEDWEKARPRLIKAKL